MSIIRPEAKILYDIRSKEISFPKALEILDELLATARAEAIREVLESEELKKVLKSLGSCCAFVRYVEFKLWKESYNAILAFGKKWGGMMSEEIKREWLCGHTPSDWFKTLKGELCCRDCEQKALIHARELYEELTEQNRVLVEALEKIVSTNCEGNADDDAVCEVLMWGIAKNALSVAREGK